MPRWGQTVVASVGSGRFVYVLIASKRHIELIASIRHNDIFLYVFFWLSYFTKIKFYLYIYSVFFQFVFIILVFVVFASLVNRLHLLIFC